MLKRFLSSAMLVAAMLATPLATNSVQAAKTATKTRIIKVYMPKKTYTRTQRARVHKGRKSHWNKYKVPSVKGYTPSRAFVPRATVKYTTKNKTVKITYKLKKKNHIAVSYINEKKLALKIINSFRAKAGVKPVKLNNYYSSVLDKRATAKAKQLAIQAFIGVGQYGGSMCLVIEMHR